MSTPIFPKWTNQTKPMVGAALVLLPLYVGFLIYYGGSPYTNNVGYRPVQPVPYSHALHAGQLGLDCRYCHTTVEKASFAAIPPTETCQNCHNEYTKIWGENENYKTLEPIQTSLATGTSVNWIKIHDLPDYAFFNHSAHINGGIGCETCHGRVDHMGADGVFQVEPLSMAWCLDCHREPEQHLRPREQVTFMGYDDHLAEVVAAYNENGSVPTEIPIVAEAIQDWAAENEGGTLDSSTLQRRIGLMLKAEYDIQDEKFMSDCTTCHR